jgi:hypothetical protein
VTLRDPWVHSVSKAEMVDRFVGQMAAQDLQAGSVFHSWDPVPAVQV